MGFGLAFGLTGAEFERGLRGAFRMGFSVGEWEDVRWKDSMEEDLRRKDSEEEEVVGGGVPKQEEVLPMLVEVMV